VANAVHHAERGQGVSGDEAKRAAAEAAVAAEVGSGMVLGLGTGTTASHVVITLGRLLRDGALQGIVGVPTSDATARLAREHGVPLSTLAEQPRLAVCLDGADEIGPGLALIKGLGGALLREKIVASAADRFVVVADASKRVVRLGEHAPVPVEVIPFGEAVCARALRALGGEPVPRDGFVTDEGNRILDCAFGPLDDPGRLAEAIRSIPGVVEHGLFLGMAEMAYVGGPDGVDVLRS
jgi:ribose 5-phosphate isomerase A